jgi:hypothetical protein
MQLEETLMVELLAEPIDETLCDSEFVDEVLKSEEGIATTALLRAHGWTNERAITFITVQSFAARGRSKLDFLQEQLSSKQTKKLSALNKASLAVPLILVATGPFVVVSATMFFVNAVGDTDRLINADFCVFNRFDRQLLCVCFLKLANSQSIDSQLDSTPMTVSCLSAPHAFHGAWHHARSYHAAHLARSRRRRAGRRPVLPAERVCSAHTCSYHLFANSLCYRQVCFATIKFAFFFFPTRAQTRLIASFNSDKGKATQSPTVEEIDPASTISQADTEVMSENGATPASTGDTGAATASGSGWDDVIARQKANAATPVAEAAYSDA